MTDDINARAVIGGNNPPDALESILSRHGDMISEAEHWLDGEPVTNVDQLAAVDKLSAAMKEARKELAAEREADVQPLHDAWKAAVAHWKPTVVDFDRIIGGLASIGGAYKKRLAEEQEEAKRKAYAEAERLKAEADAQAAAAIAGNIEAQREAQATKTAALDAAKVAATANRNKVKGLRKVQYYEIESHREALTWIAANDREALTDFINDYVRQNHRRASIDGVRQWEDREAY